MTVEIPTVTVASLLQIDREVFGLDLTLLAGHAGLTRPITVPHSQKTGLALAGFEDYLHPGRVLVFGESELRFIEGLPLAERRLTLGRALSRDIPCILMTGGVSDLPTLVAVANERGVPLIATQLPTPSAIANLTALLEDQLAPRELVHGVLVDILGLGVLIIGESGIGKSECALHLVVRGHRLVADDTVEIKRRSETVLIGTCPELIRHHMEIRGLGIIDVHDLFGVAAVRSAKRIELVVQLERWEPGEEYDRLGLDVAHYEIVGCAVAMIRMPVAPGRPLAILVEVAARNELLRARGHHAARDLADRQTAWLRQTAGDERPKRGPEDSG